jgi:hypothetical protein
MFMKRISLRVRTQVFLPWQCFGAYSGEMGSDSSPNMRLKAVSYRATASIEEISIGQFEPCLQAGFHFPAKAVEAFHGEQLSGGAIGLAGVEFQFALESDYLFYCFRQFADGEVFAAADVD